jgi:hypothetical protein
MGEASVAWRDPRKVASTGPPVEERTTAMLSTSVALVVGAVAAIIVQVLADQLVAHMTWVGVTWVGVPVAGIAGAFRARRLDRRERWPVRQAIVMALICTIAGAYAVGLVWGAGYAPFLGTVGLLYFGLPVFLLLLTPAITWACTTTFLARRGWG